MVKTLLVGLLICGSGLAHAEGGCVDATETDPRLCPAELPAVRHVRVDQQGRPSHVPPEPLVNCRLFVLTPNVVRRYFARAMRVDDSEHAVDRGPCEATGTLRFVDGKQAWWRIEQVGTATLVFDGSSEAITLYCNRCRFRPFVF
jgi:hypothetical protein